jgi:hypothetical protein
VEQLTEAVERLCENFEQLDLDDKAKERMGKVKALSKTLCLGAIKGLKSDEKN